jgi:hypothetical protein
MSGRTDEISLLVTTISFRSDYNGSSTQFSQPDCHILVKCFFNPMSLSVYFCRELRIVEESDIHLYFHAHFSAKSTIL